MIRVLAVEDSRTQAMALCHDLESAGFTVSLASTGQEALSILQGDDFDVVVSDVVMPGMDGYALCRLVKADPRTRDIPVVLLTSLTDPLDVVNALECGADNFLRKPYQAEQLVARVRAAAQNRALRRSGAPQEGIRLSLLDRPIEITADRHQVLDLLVSTFEELVVTTRDVRAREADLARAHADLQQQLLTVGLERNRLQAVVDSVPVPLFVIDPVGLVTHASRASAHVFATDTEELGGRKLEDVTRVVDGNGTPIAPEALPHHRVFQSRRAESIGGAFDAFLARADGSRVPVVLQASPVLDERGRAVGGVETAHVLGALTQHDPVTGLPNSAAYLDRAASALAASDGDCALLLLELDRFDVVRAAVGDADGALLVEVARRLRQVFEFPMQSDGPSERLLAYLGGHKFGVILEKLPGSFSVLRLAESARREVAQPYPNDLHVTASVGVALADKAPTGAELFAAANEALRRARDAGGDCVQLLGRAASQEAMTRLQLEVDLRSAVDGGSIEVNYQPEVDLTTGALIGFEALARWRHGRLGPVDPGVFIALAEESGLIFALGRQVLHLACRQARQWQETHQNEELSIAVNVSAMQLRPELVTEVREVLDETALHPSRLVLEVTETAAMSDPEATLPILDELREHGVRLALDDFGTGYSSMAYLTRTRFDQIKLDRTFVSGMDRGNADTIVAHSIIALGRALEVPVLAEGIEQPRQARILRELGCRQGQGYLFSRPLDAGAVERLLTTPDMLDWSDLVSRSTDAK